MSEDQRAPEARKVTDVLSADEIRAFTEPSDWAGACAVAASWLLISGSFALVAWYPSVLTVAIALILLGGRHLGLAILMHEASHRSLFKTRILNDVIGKWLCAAPEGNHLDLYRKHHLGHHSWAGSEKDPDLSLIEGFPVTKSSLARKFARDLAGITGVKRVYGMLAMDFGYIEYTAAKDVRPIDQTGRSRTEVWATGLRAIFPAVMTNTLMLTVLAALGHPWLYLLWVVSYLTTYSLFLRVRSIAEHVACEETLDPFFNTRTTHANAAARLTVAPHRVNYHLEHHLLMTAPYHKLPELHRTLKERGALEGCHLAPSYRRVLEIAVGANIPR